MISKDILLKSTIMKPRKPYRNSKEYTRERVLEVILPMLRAPGIIQLKDIWPVAKYVTSYSVACYIFKDIMMEMIKQGHAGYTERKGAYRLRKSCINYNPVRVEIPVREKFEPPDEPVIFERPPAIKSTQELLIEKYLNM